MAAPQKQFETKLTIENDKELAAWFEALPATMRRKHIRPATKAAGAVLIKEQRRRVPRSRTTGSTELQSRKLKGRHAGRKDLFKSITQRPSSGWDSKAAVAARGIIATAVGPRWPEGAVTHLIELGYQLTAWGRKTSIRIAARPFMRQAQKASRPKVVTTYRTKLKAGLRKEAAKAGIKVKA